MKLHRNSQKRYYINGAIYFITTVTYDRYPYFQDEILCRFFIEDLYLCKDLKKFELYGYSIIPDHVHLLIQPGNDFTISEIMRSLKTNFSRNINKIMPYKFKWQQSFHDHIIRNGADYQNHVNYIKNQVNIHDLHDDMWMWVSSEGGVT